MKYSPTEVEVAGMRVMISPVKRRTEAENCSQETRVASKVEAYAKAEGRVLGSQGIPSPVNQMKEMEMRKAVQQSMKLWTRQQIERGGAGLPSWKNKKKSRRGCFHCGSWRHRIRDCPQRDLERQDARRGEVTSTGVKATRPRREPMIR